MSTVHNGQSYVLRRRRRPAKTSTNAAIKRKPFGDLPVKEMDIPEFINQYNLYMCGVDVANQLRSYYTTQRIHLKTWKPLFHFLFDTIIGNCYKLSSYNAAASYLRANSHAAFRRALRHALLKASNQLIITREPQAGRKQIDDVT